MIFFPLLASFSGKCARTLPINVFFRFISPSLVCFSHLVENEELLNWPPCPHMVKSMIQSLELRRWFESRWLRCVCWSCAAYYYFIWISAFFLSFTVHEMCLCVKLLKFAAREDEEKNHHIVIDIHTSLAINHFLYNSNLWTIRHYIYMNFFVCSVRIQLKTCARAFGWCEMCSKRDGMIFLRLVFFPIVFCYLLLKYLPP